MTIRFLFLYILRDFILFHTKLHFSGTFLKRLRHHGALAGSQMCFAYMAAVWVIGFYGLFCRRFGVIFIRSFSGLAFSLWRVCVFGVFYFLTFLSCYLFA
jgi:hypothetical protein